MRKRLLIGACGGLFLTLSLAGRAQPNPAPSASPLPSPSPLVSVAVSAPADPAPIPTATPSMAQSPLPSPSPKPSSEALVVSRIRTPLKYTEIPHAGEARPGKVHVKFDATAGANDLEARVWKLGEVYSLELSFPFNEKESLLPVDDHGRLRPEAKRIGTDPFTKLTLPGGKTLAPNFACEKLRCRALVPRIPFEVDKSVELKLDVNLRELKQSWTFRYNQLPRERGAVKLEREAGVKVGDPDAFLSTELWRRGRYSPPDMKGQREPLRIDEWSFDPKEKLTQVAPHRVDTLTLYEIHEGDFLVEVSLDNASLETFEIKRGDRLWVPAGTILSLRAPKGGRLHHLEF